MNAMVTPIRNLAGFVLACMVCLVTFGLTLGLFQAVASRDATALWLGLSILSAGLAFVAGGFVSARLNPASWLRQALAFGLLFGGFSFVYLLGPVWNALFSTILAALLAAAGGWLAAGRTSLQ